MNVSVHVADAVDEDLAAATTTRELVWLCPRSGGIGAGNMQLKMLLARFLNLALCPIRIYSIERRRRVA